MLSYLKLLLIIIDTIISSIAAIIFSIVDRSFKLYFWLSRAWSKSLLVISGIKVEVSGAENVPTDGVYVYVSNHSSQFDIPVMQHTVPTNMSIVFKKELGKIPLFGWQLMLGPYIMIDRQNADKAIKSIEDAKKLMSEKKVSILVFAEGTRSKTGEVQPFKRGAFYLASRVGFPIVPVSISGATKILPKGKFKINPGKVNVHYGKPISTENIKTRKDELDLMENVREIVIKNLEVNNVSK